MKIFKNKIEKQYTIYSIMRRFFWWNMIGATLVLPILPLITAYREWRFIEYQKDFDCSKWIVDFRINKMWWKLLKTHYQSWFGKLKWYNAERGKRAKL